MSDSADGCFKLIGYWETKLYGPDGIVKDVQSGSNVITTVGKTALSVFLASAAAASTTFTAGYIAIGTGNTAETNADTALNSELTRTTGTASAIATAIYQVTATFAAGVGTGAIQEYGLFNSSANGTMYARYTKSTINKGAGDTLVVIAQLTLS